MKLINGDCLEEMKTKLPEAFINLNRDNIEAYTPKYAVDIILPYIPKNKVIWAPFSEDYHNFAEYLREKGYKVVNTHYNPKTGAGDDFLVYEPDFTLTLFWITLHLKVKPSMSKKP